MRLHVKVYFTKQKQILTLRVSLKKETKKIRSFKKGSTGNSNFQNFGK